ncbi:MAG: glycosyltransferase [Candidatus Eisenbacteria bacterium]|nr:glycosyltransferase [Candidatus Eisenbacteria bacterium]
MVKECRGYDAMNYLLTGGGTGGHVYPALAIAEQIRLVDPGASFLYVGVRGRAEEHLVPVTGIPLRRIPAAGLPAASSPLALARFAATEVAGIARAMALLRRWRPDVIVGTGGYVSAPVVLANALLTRCGVSRTPVVLHEQNAVPGRLNRLAGAWATLIASSYPSAVPFFPKGKAVVSGYPVRSKIAEPLSRDEARRELRIEPDRRVVLVFGGSLGSRSLNRGIVGALPALGAVEGLLIIHATGRPGRGGYDPVADTARAAAALPRPPDPNLYRSSDYLDPMSTYLAAADLVVSRAGAGTLNELCAIRRAGLLVPKANLPGDHQVRNALALQAAGAAEVLYERPVRIDETVVEQISPDELAVRITALMNDPGRLAELGDRAGALATPGAARWLATAVVHLAQGRPVEPVPPPVPWPDAGGDTDRFALLPASALLNSIRSRQKNGPPLSPQERSYLAYRTDGYLAASGWEGRNWGVKLAGALCYGARVDIISAFVVERRRHHRAGFALVGLSHAQNGFVRRNALTALAEIGVWNGDVRRAALCALRDCYFEVRSAGVLLVDSMAEFVRGDGEIEDAVLTLTDDPRFEVRAAALAALGVVGQGPDTVSRLTSHFLDANWRVRAAAVKGLTRMLERHLVSRDDLTRVSDAISGLLITSTGFKPLFELKDALASLSRTLRGYDSAEPAV